MTKSVVTLADKYEQTEGRILIGSLQAVVRLLLDQARRDRAVGVATAGYVTGYRGSPVTTLDAQLWAAQRQLDAHDIRFEPGLNEELAATSLRGTQQISWFGKPRVEGVFALWYAKGIGVDRAHEAIKLGNLEGTSAHGGVLLLAGDDHAAKSSASAHQSDQNLAAAFVPTLYPATTDEFLSYGQHGWALSRHAGLYCGFKTITDTLDLTASVDLPAQGFPLVLPPREGPPLNLREGMPALEQEALTVEHRLPAAQAYVRANALDRVTHGGRDNALTIVTAGKAWLDVAQALIDLGLTPDRCAKLGIRVVKLALTWPVEPHFLRQALAGAAEVLVVEEKRAFIEEQIARLLFGLGGAPRLSGKTDPEGEPLLSAAGVLDAGCVADAISRRLRAMGRADEAFAARHDALTAAQRAAAGIRPEAMRPAYFCSGCPHSTSTVVPEGSAAMGATGCHGLAHYMPGRRTMQTVGMGSEGMPWVAAQGFVDTPHYFQNLGDGTFNHSGLLTIRASVAAKSNVTFKILYNDAVAMTGGQPMEGGLSPERIVHELVIEGVAPVVLVSEDPSRFRSADLPAGTRILHRDALDSVQRELREVPGTSAIVYEQTCANEKRRRRKRGTMSDPDERLFINEAVCEGCGDCSVQSNCLSVEPIETAFGRKRRINQSSCNKDYSCIKGFCPSFVTLKGARPARRALDLAAIEARVAQLPEPVFAGKKAVHDMLITGIGGTGVLTIGAVLAMAVHLDGRSAKLLDMTGMAQKGGAVVSHLRIADSIEDVPSARLGTGQADLVIACDLVVATGPDVLRAAGPQTRLVANADVAPTAEFQSNNAVDFSAIRFLAALRRRIGAEQIDSLRAGALAERLLGDAIFTNFMMVGFAAQRGLVPVSVAAIEKAIELNGVSISANLTALRIGRLAAVDLAFVMTFANLGEFGEGKPGSLADLVADRTAFLAEYQDAAYAARFRAKVTAWQQVLDRRGIASADPFLHAAADQLSRLMAYKDEYEVARLYTRPQFRAAIDAAFDGAPKLSLNLAPPFLPLGKDRKTGRPRKIRLSGSWILPVMRLLARGRRLRGTALDPFGSTAERRMERAVISEFTDQIDSLLAAVTDETLALATEIAETAQHVRGYGPVKEEGVARWRNLSAEKLARFAAATGTTTAVPESVRLAEIA